MGIVNTTDAAVIEARQLISTVRADGECGGHAMGTRTAISLAIVVENESTTRVDVSIQAFGHVQIPWKQFVVMLQDQDGNTLRVPLNRHGHGFLTGYVLAGLTWLRGIDLQDTGAPAGLGRGAAVVDVSRVRPSKRPIQLVFSAEVFAVAAGPKPTLPPPTESDGLWVEATLVPERTLRVTVRDPSSRDGFVVLRIRSRQSETAEYSRRFRLESGVGVWDVRGELLPFPVDDELILEVEREDH